MPPSISFSNDANNIGAASNTITFLENLPECSYTGTGSVSGVTCFARQLSRLSRRPRRISRNIRLNFYFSISGLGRFLPTAARLPSRWRPLELFDRSVRTGTQVEISTNFIPAHEQDREILYGRQGSDSRVTRVEIRLDS